jgi:hypothetical protein
VVPLSRSLALSRLKVSVATILVVADIPTLSVHTRSVSGELMTIDRILQAGLAKTSPQMFSWALQ